MRLRPFITAVLLSVAATSSFAVDIAVTLTGGSGFFGATRTGSFSDNFTFTAPTSTSASSVVSSINLGGLQDVMFTSVNLTTGPAFGTIVANFVTTSSGQIEIRTLTGSPALTAGTQYAISVVGSSNGGSGSYSGTINVTPVPEPQTYALMFAGLAGVGFIAARRKRG